MPIVLQDKNGVCYLQTASDVVVAKGVLGIRAIVNRGHEVQVVKLDYHTVESLWLQPIEDKNKVALVIQKLLSPSDQTCIVSSLAKLELSQLLKEETEMAKKAAVEAPAAVPTKKAKFADVTAPAADKAVKVPKTPAEPKEPRGPMTLDELKDNALYATKVKATAELDKAKAGSLWARVKEYATKPITLAELIQKIVASDLVLKSEKDREMVVRVRVKDAFTRLGYLEEAK